MESGECLGHYEILQLLGKGGMGDVYLARDQRLGRKVALKRLPAPWVGTPEALRRFQREAAWPRRSTIRTSSPLWESNGVEHPR